MCSSFISLFLLRPVLDNPNTNWEPDGTMIHLRPDQIVMIETLEPESYKISLCGGRDRFVAIDDDTLNNRILIGSSPGLHSDSYSPRESKKDCVWKAIELAMRHWLELTRDPDPDFRESLAEIYVGLEAVYREAAKLRVERGLLPYSWDALKDGVERLIASGHAEPDPTNFINGRLDLHEVRLTKRGLRFLPDRPKLKKIAGPC